jgi:hypothetical protein
VLGRKKQITVAHDVYSREDMLTLTRTAFSETCPIKGRKKSHNRAVEELEKKSTATEVSVSELYVTFIL